LCLGKTISNHHKDLSEENFDLQEINHPNAAAIHATPDPSKISPQKSAPSKY
jgi:hypothetical protein